MRGSIAARPSNGKPQAGTARSPLGCFLSHWKRGSIPQIEYYAPASDRRCGRRIAQISPQNKQADESTQPGTAKGQAGTQVFPRAAGIQAADRTAEPESDTGIDGLPARLVSAAEYLIDVAQCRGMKRTKTRRVQGLRKQQHGKTVSTPGNDHET